MSWQQGLHRCMPLPATAATAAALTLPALPAVTLGWEYQPGTGRLEKAGADALRAPAQQAWMESAAIANAAIEELPRCAWRVLPLCAANKQQALVAGQMLASLSAHKCTCHSGLACTSCQCSMQAYRCQTTTWGTARASLRGAGSNPTAGTTAHQASLRCGRGTHPSRVHSCCL